MVPCPADREQTNFSRPRLKNLTRIAIDEISIGKDHRYLTVVLNLLGGAVVFVGDGKGVEALNPFWRRLKKSRAKKTLERHRSGILAYFDFPITTGPLEGTNNKIITLQKQAYGYRDMEFFELKIYDLHETKYALVG